MKKYGRSWQSYFLLSAVLFKSMVVGMFLTLATHNICLNQLLTKDLNWQLLVAKQRKRQDEHNCQQLLSAEDAVLGQEPYTPGPSFFALVLRNFRQILVFFKPSIHQDHFSRLPFTPQRIFLQHCAILR